VEQLTCHPAAERRLHYRQKAKTSAIQRHGKIVIRKKVNGSCFMFSLLTRELAEDYLGRWVTEIGPRYVWSLGVTDQAKDGVDNADIVQNAGIKFWGYVGRPVHKPMSLLCTIAKRLVFNHCRRRKREAVSIAFPDELPDHRTSEAECRGKARDARLRLARIRRACPWSVRKAIKVGQKAEGETDKAAVMSLKQEGILSPTLAQVSRRRSRICSYLFRARQYAPPDCGGQIRRVDKAA
jgi:hypothetical protein